MDMRDVSVVDSSVPGAAGVLTADALQFVVELQREFRPVRDELLRRRAQRRAETARTHRLDFLAETADVRADDSWRVASAPADMRDRRVEITGPTERKMAINALNSGANVWLADLEDANTPHWNNVVAGQVNLYDAVRGTIALRAPDGKDYQLRDDGRTAVVVMRPRGWHLDERHIAVDRAPVVAALVDFGLYLYHNAGPLLAAGSGPYFYLPKMESHREARLWQDVFAFAQQRLGVPYGTIRATVLIETVPAAFEMDEILYELRDHASGLNAGRWDYLFSLIKNFRDSGSGFVLPDRGAITMTAPFMRAYTELLVRTCHARGAFAMGGMAAFVPSRRDPEANARALARVREDKQREAADGFDGSWVAHPDLVPVCREAFDAVLGARPNQLDRRRDDVEVTAAQLLDVAGTPGSVTIEGLTNNVYVALRYLASWLAGTGAVAILNLMEDAATAEIARSQIWQWVHNSVALPGAGVITKDLVRRLVAEQVERIRSEGEPGRLDDAAALFETVALADDFTEFLTTAAYPMID
jgi:malate synthase